MYFMKGILQRGLIMVIMNQGDLFLLLKELKIAKQVEIAQAICESSPLINYEKNMESSISKALKGQNGRPVKNLLDAQTPVEKFIDSFFQLIFKDFIASLGASETIILQKFNEIKTYLSVHQLTFSGRENLENNSADFDTYVKYMLLEAFQHHQAHSSEDKNTVDSMLSESVNDTCSIQPSLHPQIIYCPSHFFSREDILLNMEQILSNYKLVVLSGIGGIGKTYLSRQYAYLHNGQYNYEQIITYDNNFRSIKKAILSLQFNNLNESEMNDNDRFDKRMSLLKQMSENTLLIIDNVNAQPCDMDIFNDLRINSKLHIIVTTRLTDCFSIDQTILVSPMSSDDQLLFFKHHYIDDLDKTEIPTVNKILDCIDGHTLLIELVAKSMHAGAMSPNQMYDYLQGNIDAELLPISISKDNFSSEKRTMSDFIKLLFDVGYLDDTAKEALLYLSLLPIEGVNRTFFYNLMPKFRLAFNDLISNSWAIEDINGKILRLHPVIRELIRKDMHPTIKNCINVMTNMQVFLQTSSEIKDDDKLDICHILGSISEISTFFEGSTNVSLLTFLADFCFKSYSYEIALNLYLSASKVAADCPIQTITEINLIIGDVYKRLACYEDSIRYYLLAKESNSQLQDSREKLLQEANIYERLSDIYRKDSQYDEAIKYNDLAISIYENLPEKENPQLAEIYNRRGIIYLNKASKKDISSEDKNIFLEEALQFYIKALNIREHCHDTPRQLAYSYHNIGTAYNKLGEYKLAKKMHSKALTIRENSNDIPATDIASSYVWIGNDYLAMGTDYYELAEENFEKSLQIRQDKLGKTHPEVAWSLMSLSELNEKKHNYNEALSYAQRAYDIRIAKFSATHNYVLQVMDWINYLQNLLISVN